MTVDPLAQVAALRGVAEAVAGARDGLDRFLGPRGVRGQEERIAAETSLRGARASAALEGAEVPLAEVRELARAAAEGSAGAPGATSPSPLGGQPAAPPAGPLAGPLAVVAGALRLAADLPALRAVWERAPLQALARLHVLAAAGTLPAEEVGRPRSGPPGDLLGLGPAPPAPEAAARLDELARLVQMPTGAPAVVTAAVVHGELLAVRPFVSGNGLVARAAERLVLLARGVDRAGLCSPETGYVELGAEAYRAAALGYCAGTAEGVAGWVRHCAEALRLGARDGRAVGEALSRAGRR